MALSACYQPKALSDIACTSSGAFSNKSSPLKHHHYLHAMFVIYVFANQTGVRLFALFLF